jgi:hypothetical protein
VPWVAIIKIGSLEGEVWRLKKYIRDIAAGSKKGDQTTSAAQRSEVNEKKLIQNLEIMRALQPITGDLSGRGVFDFTDIEGEFPANLRSLDLTSCVLLDYLRA